MHSSAHERHVVMDDGLVRLLGRCLRVGVSVAPASTFVNAASAVIRVHAPALARSMPLLLCAVEAEAEAITLRSHSSLTSSRSSQSDSAQSDKKSTAEAMASVAPLRHATWLRVSANRALKTRFLLTLKHPVTGARWNVKLLHSSSAYRRPKNALALHRDRLVAQKAYLTSAKADSHIQAGNFDPSDTRRELQADSEYRHADGTAQPGPNADLKASPPVSSLLATQAAHAADDCITSTQLRRRRIKKALRGDDDAMAQIVEEGLWRHGARLQREHVALSMARRIARSMRCTVLGSGSGVDGVASGEKIVDEVMEAAGTRSRTLAVMISERLLQLGWIEEKKRHQGPPGLRRALSSKIQQGNGPSASSRRGSNGDGAHRFVDSASVQYVIKLSQTGNPGIAAASSAINAPGRRTQVPQVSLPIVRAHSLSSMSDSSSADIRDVPSERVLLAGPVSGGTEDGSTPTTQAAATAPADVQGSHHSRPSSGNPTYDAGALDAPSGTAHSSIVHKTQSAPSNTAGSELGAAASEQTSGSSSRPSSLRDSSGSTTLPHSMLDKEPVDMWLHVDAIDMQTVTLWADEIFDSAASLEGSQERMMSQMTSHHPLDVNDDEEEVVLDTDAPEIGVIASTVLTVTSESTPGVTATTGTHRSGAQGRAFAAVPSAEFGDSQRKRSSKSNDGLLLRLFRPESGSTMPLSNFTYGAAAELLEYEPVGDDVRVHLKAGNGGAGHLPGTGGSASGGYGGLVLSGNSPNVNAMAHIVGATMADVFNAIWRASSTHAFDDDDAVPFVESVQALAPSTSGLVAETQFDDAVPLRDFDWAAWADAALADEKGHAAVDHTLRSAAGAMTARYILGLHAREALAVTPNATVVLVNAAHLREHNSMVQEVPGGRSVVPRSMKLAFQALDLWSDFVLVALRALDAVREASYLVQAAAHALYPKAGASSGAGEDFIIGKNSLFVFGSREEAMQQYRRTILQ